MLLEVQQPWRTPEQSYVEARDKKNGEIKSYLKTEKSVEEGLLR